MSHRCPQELRERAVRLVAESREEYESGWAAIASVATKLGIGSTETLASGCAGPRSTPVSVRG
jgi:transposase